MRKIAALFAALSLLLCACAGQNVPAPEGENIPAQTTESAAPIAEETTPDVSAQLCDILTAISVSFQPQSAGCSLSAAKLAGRILDWHAANQPSSSSVTEWTQGYLAGLDQAARDEFPARLADIRAAARELCAESAAELLEEAGYTPQFFPWSVGAVDTVFTAIEAGCAS